MQKRNAELEQEVAGLEKHAAIAPEGRMKTKVSYDGKTYVEKVVVEEEKSPVYVQQRGPELTLALGGFIQTNFEDGDVSAFEGRFGQTALKDRFRLRRARINVTGGYFLIPKKLQAVVQWQDLNPGQKGDDGLYSILGGLNYYIHGDDLKVMVNYIHTWSDFRQANPEFGQDQFDQVLGRVQVMF